MTLSMTTKIKTPGRVDIFGTKFSNVNLESAIDFLTKNKFETPKYVCFPSTDTITVAYNNPKFQKILNKSLITFVDGKFTEFYLRLKGYKDIKNVSGYWLLENLLQTPSTHYFYGCDNQTLKALDEKLRIKFPNAKILGFKAPPFVQLEEIYHNKQIVEDFKKISSLGPDYIWVGISTPKQDFLMHHYVKHLEKGVMFGVGAVLLYHSGAEKKGPEFLKKLGLRWLLRVIKNPGRIKQRKVFYNLIFVIKLVVKHDLLRLKLNKK